MVIVEIPKDEKTEDMLDSFIEHFKELKDEVSEIRKQGLDTSLVDLMMMDFLPKVKLARATYEDKDIDQLKRQLAQIRHEIDIIKSGTEFDEALQKIKDAYDKIRAEKYADAHQLYAEIQKIYNNLPEDSRRVVYKAALDIRQKIQNKTGKDGN
jgi:hypothetical protein